MMWLLVELEFLVASLLLTVKSFSGKIESALAFNDMLISVPVLALLACSSSGNWDLYMVNSRYTVIVPSSGCWLVRL